MSEWISEEYNTIKWMNELMDKWVIQCNLNKWMSEWISE
jgi:hypothetical protein